MRLPALFALVVAALGTLAGCRGWESDQPPVHWIPNMDTQEKGRAYRKDTTGLFADGRMMRPPVEGTVAVGELREDDLLETGLMPDGNPTLKYPPAILVDGRVPDALRARGQDRYQIFCAPCHGAALDGKGTVAQVNLTKPGKGLQVPPPALTDDRIIDLPVGKIYAAMLLGVNNGNMATYASQIPVEDRWAIVTWVRKVQMDKKPGMNEEGGVGAVAKQATASVDYGAALYKAKGCVACHTLDGNRTVGPTFKGLAGKTENTSAGDVVVDEAYLRESMLQPMAKIVTGYPPAMPPLPLDAVEVDSLILFIQAQK